MRKKLNACGSTLNVKFELAVPNNSKLEQIYFCQWKRLMGRSHLLPFPFCLWSIHEKMRDLKEKLKIKIEEFCYPEVHDTSSAV